MKIDGSLIITRNLKLINPGGSSPAVGLVAVSDSEGNLRWEDFSVPALRPNTRYPKPGTLSIYAGSLYMSIVENASSTDIQDPALWKDMSSGSSDSELSEDQLAALNAASEPSAGNPFVTAKDVHNLSIKGTATSEIIVSKSPIQPDNVWISSTNGVDSYGTAVLSGDGLASDGTGWKNIGPIRGPKGGGQTLKEVTTAGATTDDNISLLKNGNSIHLSIGNVNGNEVRIGVDEFGDPFLIMVTEDGAGIDLDSSLLTGMRNLKFPDRDGVIATEDWVNDIISVANELPDAITKMGTTSVSNNKAVIATNSYNWRVNKVLFENTPSYTSAVIDFTAPGKLRIDSVIGTNTGGYQYIKGPISSVWSTEPPLPVNTIRLSNVLVSENAIQVTPLPEDDALYLKRFKSTYKTQEPFYNIFPNEDDYNAIFVGSTSSTVVVYLDGVGGKYIKNGAIYPLKNYGTGIITVQPQAGVTIHSPYGLVLNKGHQCYLIKDDVNEWTLINPKNISNVDNTADIDKPVSTAQGIADALVLTTANAYTDAKAAMPILTDESLHFDVTTRTLSSNIGTTSQYFNYVSGIKEFLLVNKPVVILHISINGVGLSNPFDDYILDVASKKITVLANIPLNCDVTVSYQFLINE